MLLAGAGLCTLWLVGRSNPRPDDVAVVDLATGRQIDRFVREDALLGYRPIPNLAVRVEKRSATRTPIYDVTYTFDSRSRRYTPTSGEEGRDHFAIFTGGSFAFGEGLNDNETLPFYFGTLTRHYLPYNYGFSGYGTQQMLALLEAGELRSEIEPKRGVLLYVYLNLHISRVIGSLRVVNGWGANMPYYDLDEPGKVRRFGSFKSGRPWTYLLFTIAARTRLQEYFNLRYPRHSAQQDVLVAKVIEASRERFLELFPGSRFLVLIYPRTGRSRMIQLLQQRGIQLLDYQELFDPKDPSLRIPGDGHPTAKANRIVARQLVADVVPGQ